MVRCKMPIMPFTLGFTCLQSHEIWHQLPSKKLAYPFIFMNQGPATQPFMMLTRETRLRPRPLPGDRGTWKWLPYGGNLTALGHWRLIWASQACDGDTLSFLLYRWRNNCPGDVRSAQILVLRGISFLQSSCFQGVNSTIEIRLASLSTPRCPRPTTWRGRWKGSDNHYSGPLIRQD